jgi:hypothetical protein
MNLNPRKQPASSAEGWREFVATELKIASKLGKIFEQAGFGGYVNKTLTLYFPNESACKLARGQVEPLKRKLPGALQPCDRVNFLVGNVPVSPPSAIVSAKSPKRLAKTLICNPLQALNHAEFRYDDKGSCKGREEL